MTQENAKRISIRHLVALGLHSAAIIAYQLILMQALSHAQWHHFAFMIISIAMLGFGASGSLLALFRNSLVNAAPWLIPFLMTLSGALMPVSYQLSQWRLIEFDLYLLFVHQEQFLKLAIHYLVFFLPFFIGALAIGLLFYSRAKLIGTLYFANLIGSGMGGLLALGLLHILLPLKSIPLIALLSILSAVIFLPAKPWAHRLLPGIGLSLILNIWFWFAPGAPNLSQYKDISRALQLPKSIIEFEQPGIHGFLEVISSPYMRYAPGISLSYTGEVPIAKSVFVNGDFAGIIPLNNLSKHHIYHYTTRALPYIINQGRRNVLILDAGTGDAIAHALKYSPAVIDAVIENKQLIELIKGPYALETNDLFRHPAVNIHFQGSRSFIMQNPTASYDAIILPGMETFGGSVGLNALKENHILTQEALALMWELLSDKGVIAITSWLDYPPKTVLKIAASFADMLIQKGIENPLDHVVAIRSWGDITYIVKKTPVNFIETCLIRQFCTEMFFDPLIMPENDHQSRFNHHDTEIQSLLLLIEDLFDPQKKPDILKNYPFHIEPASDDKPFFSRFLKFSDLPVLIREIGSQNLAFIELGYLMVWITLIQSSILAFILIILPLFRLRATGGGRLYTLGYFSALGLGFMFVEIIFIHHFSLYLGHPIYAVSAVITTMLMASGIGSLWAQKILAIHRFQIITPLIICILLVIYAYFLPTWLQSSIHASFSTKIVLTFFILTIPAFFMGMPFPLAIRQLNQHTPNQIPWAWGINGCFSVMATSLATLGALENGFFRVMLSAAIFYFIAFGVSLKK